MFDLALSSSGANDYIYSWAAGFGLYVSFDSGNLLTLGMTMTGATFTRKFGSATQDLNYWRGAIAVAPSNPNRIYCTVSPDNNPILGIYRSGDGGNTWANVLNLGKISHDSRDNTSKYTSGKIKSSFVNKCLFWIQYWSRTFLC